MKIYALGFAGAVAVVLWQVGVFHTLFSTLVNILAALLGIIMGIIICLCSGKQREPPTPKPSAKIREVSQYLAKLTTNEIHKPYKHKTVISRPIDKAVQEVFDLFVRDFCLLWFRDLGKDEAAFVDLITEECWTLTRNIVERLKSVDTVKFLSQDVVNILTTHFQNLRLADTRNISDTPIPFSLHSCLRTRTAELEYLTKASEVLLYCFLPRRNAACAGLRYLLRELLAYSVFQPLADMICDPDYIYQTLLLQLEAKEALTAKHKQGYAYAETYEEFIKMISTRNSVEDLKQIRYHIIAEIMQATTINNLKGIDKQSQSDKSLNKDTQLRARNLKRYINQCTVAKAQCEKRIKLLGGPDYTSHTDESKPEEQKSSKAGSKKVPSKVLLFTEIMDNSLARSCFMLYLQNKTSSKNMLSFWMAIENLKLVRSAELHNSAQEIYQVYVAPSSEKSIMLDTTLVRGIEDFLNGAKGLNSYFEAQEKVFHILEEKFYRMFILSEQYTMFVCQSEAQMDDLRAQQKDEGILELHWNETDTTDEEDHVDANRTPKLARKPSTIEERSDSIVKKLQVLDQRLAAKTQQLELIKRSYGADEEEMEHLAQEFEDLIMERRHLEYHIERTDQWCDNLGKWKVHIESVQWDPDSDKSGPLFVIVVHCSPDDLSTPLPPGEEMLPASVGGPAGASSEGWVVTRKIKDFELLHSKLKECCSWLPKELPVPSKKWYKSVDGEFLERSRIALGEYLQSLMADEKLNLSEELYSFLSPSPEHLRRQSLSQQSNKKTGFSLISMLKSLPFDISILNEEAEEEASLDTEDSGGKKDSIAEPVYALIGEVFELKGVFKWLRRTLIAFVQITFGGTINKQILEMVEWLVSESMLIYYIHNFRDSMWPGGQLAKAAPPRTDAEKLETKNKAKQKLLKNIPEVLQSLVGKKNSKLGTIKVFEAFQDIRVNKHLFYVLFELCIFTLCPEVRSEEIVRRAKKREASSGLTKAAR